MSGRKQALGYVHPTGHRPYRDPARLDYRDNAELKTQLAQYAKSKWTTATRIDVDLGTNEILVDGTVVAGFAISEPRSSSSQTAIRL